MTGVTYDIAQRRQNEKRKFHNGGYVPGRGSGPKPPLKGDPAVWSHQHDLKAAIGKEVFVQLSGDNFLVGKLLEADQFTLKLEDIGKGVIVVFKSAVAYFKVR